MEGLHGEVEGKEECVGMHAQNGMGEWRGRWAWGQGQRG